MFRILSGLETIVTFHCASPAIVKLVTINFPRSGKCRIFVCSLLKQWSSSFELFSNNKEHVDMTADHKRDLTFFCCFGIVENQFGKAIGPFLSFRGGPFCKVM